MTGYGVKEGDKMDFLKGSAVITDASHPAAEAIAQRLHRDGVKVVKNYPCGLNNRSILSTEESYEFDTCSLFEMKQLLAEIAERGEIVRYLIHTDYEIYRTSIEEISEENYSRNLNRNAKSAFISTKVFGEHIAEQGGGAILYISSLHDEKPTGCSFTFSVGKGAVKMLSKEMALFYGRRGVRVNLIELDILKGEKEKLDSRISPFHYEAESKIPLNRFAEPQDAAGLAAFLLSEEARFINGADIRVDGGHLLYYRDR